MIPLAALALLATAAPQGIIVGPIKIPPGTIVVPPKPVVAAMNLIANAGFEASTIAPWQSAGTAYYYVADPETGASSYDQEALPGYLTASDPHSGQKAFCIDAGPGLKEGNTGYDWVQSEATLRQTLAKPVLGSAIVNASAWVSGYGDSLQVMIEYTSGAPTYDYSPTFDAAWQKWDFRSAIDPSRTVKSIQFGFGQYYDAPAPWLPARIDDVNVSIMVRI